MTQVSSPQQAKTSPSKIAQAAGMGMALMGSSYAHADPEIDHGYSPARWAGVLTSLAGWLVAAFGLPLHVWPLLALGAALQVVAVLITLLMNKAGLGHDNNRQWATLKAQSQAARPAAQPHADPRG
jgi:hypothetical protein